MAPPVSVEGEHDAAVLLALVLDFGHRDRADLARVADMRAAAGLQVDTRNFDKAHLPHPAWRLHRHRPYELGLGGELRVGYPPRPDRARLCDQLIEAAREHLLVEARSGHVEIEAAPAVGNLT